MRPWVIPEGLSNKVMAAEYQTALPDEKELAAEIERTQAIIEKRKPLLLPSRQKEKTKIERKTKVRKGD